MLYGYIRALDPDRPAQQCYMRCKACGYTWHGWDDEEKCPDCESHEVEPD